MTRTANRPLVSQRITTTDAVLFAIWLLVIGIALLGVAANLLTIVLSIVALIGYSYIYTRYLKYATSQNIVIGGVAGAFPPLLGWVAITGEVTAQPLLMMAIIYVWTPAHFWALAIDRVEDYKAAKLPMLPVTHGLPFTRLNILLYAILTVVCSVFYYLVAGSGVIYLSVAIVAGIYFVYSAWRLHSSPDTTTPMSVFTASNWYLMVLFIAMLVDWGYPISGYA